MSITLKPFRLPGKNAKISGERNQQAEDAVAVVAEQTETNVCEVLDSSWLIQNWNCDNNDCGGSDISASESSSCSGDSTVSGSSQFCPGFLLRILAIFSCCSGDNKSVACEYQHTNTSHGRRVLPRGGAGYLTNEINEFLPGVWRFLKNIRGEELSGKGENDHRQLYSDWNTFLQQELGIRGTSVSISPDINRDINKFIPWRERVDGERCTSIVTSTDFGFHWGRDITLTENKKKWIKFWLTRWNMFHQARAGETLVTRCSVCLTIVGFIFYIVDLVSDIGTSMYYLYNGQWWQAIVTLMLMYGAVIYYTVWKWTDGQIHCTGAAARLRYVATLLVNWPDVQQYGALCLLEWERYKSPAGRAHLVVEWHERRVRVAWLKFTEGVWEACPQAVLQLCLLLPDLYGAWTWTDYLRIASASVSLCTAGAALVNLEKYWRICRYTDVPPSELVVLYVWAGPVTVARLVSVTLLLTLHPYWALAGVALHLVLPGVDWCITVRPPRTLTDVIGICLATLHFFISPFNVGRSLTIRRALHVIHCLGNTAVTVVWALGTPLASAHPALYAAILCCNAAMFAVGVVGWQVHEKKCRR